MNKLLVPLIVLTTICSTVRSEQDSEALHFAAHFGMSYAINSIGFEIATKAFHMNKYDALVFSAVTTLLIGLSYKWVTDSRSQTFNNDLGSSMLYNSMGVTTFGLTVLVFK